MKAIKVYKFGDPQVLQIEDVVTLVPEAGEVVVDVKAAGVNPVDAYIRSGNYPVSVNFPYTPGIDGAGIIKAVGENVKKFAAGDRIYFSGCQSGAYAQEAKCLSSQVFFLPENISFEQGAAVGIPYSTAYRALFTKARAVDQEIIFIHGASGGVGVATLQLAKMANIKIIGSAGSERGLSLVKEQGADHVVNHNQPGYMKEVARILNGQGVDIVVEMLANVNLDADLNIIAKNGRIVVVGCRGEAVIHPRLAMVQDATILGMAVMNASLEERIKIFSSLAEGLKTNKLNPV
ncbi:MAG: NADPH:quinone reductase, partial [Candidatus Omnitrophica bacterium]|nr:NADPH:quinone reductase [Candidatus Omnitrophota bacterium]